MFKFFENITKTNYNNKNTSEKIIKNNDVESKGSHNEILSNNETEDDINKDKCENICKNELESSSDEEEIYNRMRNKDKLNKYMISCKKKAIYHHKNALIAKEWDNLSNVLIVVLTAGQALSMTLMTVYESRNVEITAIGAVFAFVIAILTRIISVSDFDITSYRHNFSADEFNSLENSIRILMDDIESQQYDNNTFKQYVLKYTSICEKSHIQPIKYFWFMFCISEPYDRLNKKGKELSDGDDSL